MVLPAIPFVAPEALAPKAEPPPAKVSVSPADNMGSLQMPPNPTMTFNDAAGEYGRVYQSEDETMVVHNPRTGNWFEV